MAGEYRKLFQEGLEMLMATDLAKGRTDLIPEIMKTLGKLTQPEFQFGRVHPGQLGNHAVPLFLQS